MNSWYIETWAPRDGVAFASQRQARAEDLGWVGSIDRTVCIRPPHWDAVEVRSATALRALQLPFQGGLSDANGSEIAFDDLSTLIEVVRRAYVAGGGDSDSGPESVDGEPGPEGPEPQFGDYLIEEWRKASEWIPDQAGAKRALPFRRAGGKLGLAQAEQMLRGALGVTLPDAVERVIVQILKVFVTRVSRSAGNQRFRESLFTWVTLMIHGGLLDAGLAFQTFNGIDPAMASDLADTWDPHRRPWAPAYWQGWPSAPPIPLLFHVPMPAMWMRRSDKERLIDALLLALSAPSAVNRLRSVDELAVWLVAASTISVQQGGDWWTRPDRGTRKQTLLAASYLWLANELPAKLASPVGVADALDVYARNVTLPR